MLDLDSISIRLITPDDSLEELTAMLHRAYKQLGDMGLKYLASHQSVEMTRKRIEKGEGWVAVLEGAIIGTFTLYPPAYAYGKCDWYQREEVAFMGQFGIEPVYQRQGLGRLMLDHAEARALELGASELGVDTAEPATHLIKIYTSRGYRQIEIANWEVTNYLSVILSKTL